MYTSVASNLRRGGHPFSLGSDSEVRVSDDVTCKENEMTFGALCYTGMMRRGVGGSCASFSLEVATNA